MDYKLKIKTSNIQVSEENKTEQFSSGGMILVFWQKIIDSTNLLPDLYSWIYNLGNGGTVEQLVPFNAIVKFDDISTYECPLLLMNSIVQNEIKVVTPPSVVEVPSTQGIQIQLTCLLESLSSQSPYFQVGLNDLVQWQAIKVIEIG